VYSNQLTNKQRDEKHKLKSNNIELHGDGLWTANNPLQLAIAL